MADKENQNASTINVTRAAYPELFENMDILVKHDPVLVGRTFPGVLVMLASGAVKELEAIRKKHGKRS